MCGSIGRRARPRRGLDQARSHQIDRVLGRWNDDEIAKMEGGEALGIAVLRMMRRTLLQELGADPRAVDN